jgi:hypothetical protein
MRFVVLWPLMLLVMIGGCSEPRYLTVPVSAPAAVDPRVTPARPEHAPAREQHLGQLREDLRLLEEDVLRAEQARLQACQAPDASQLGTVAYQRCPLKDQLYERAKQEAAQARDRYLRAVSGRGGVTR